MKPIQNAISNWGFSNRVSNLLAVTAIDGSCIFILMDFSSVHPQAPLNINVEDTCKYRELFSGVPPTFFNLDLAGHITTVMTGLNSLADYSLRLHNTVDFLSSSGSYVMWPTLLVSSKADGEPIAHIKVLKNLVFIVMLSDDTPPTDLLTPNGDLGVLPIIIRSKNWNDAVDTICMLRQPYNLMVETDKNGDQVSVLIEHEPSIMKYVATLNSFSNFCHLSDIIITKEYNGIKECPYALSNKFVTEMVQRVNLDRASRSIELEVPSWLINDTIVMHPQAGGRQKNKLPPSPKLCKKDLERAINLLSKKDKIAIACNLKRDNKEKIAEKRDKKQKILFPQSGDFGNQKEQMSEIFDTIDQASNSDCSDSDNLWSKIKNIFTLNHSVAPDVKNKLDEFSDLLKRVSDNGVEVKVEFPKRIIIILVGVGVCVTTAIMTRDYSLAKKVVGVVIAVSVITGLSYLNDIVAFINDFINSEDEEVLEPQGYSSSQVASFCGVLYTIVCGYIGGVPVNKRGFENFLVKTSLLSRAKGTMSDIFVFILEVIEKCFNFIRQNVLGLDKIHLIEKTIPGLRKWCDEVDRVISLSQSGRFPLIAENANIVYQLDKRGREFETAKYGSNFDLLEVKTAISAFKQPLRALVTRFESSNLTGNGTRMEPLGVLVYGKSGVGKTNAVEPLIRKLLIRVLPPHLVEHAKSCFGDFVYYRQAEHKYWDGYRGQTVTVFDDFAQCIDVAGNPDNEYMEIVRCINTSPMICHMADISSKGTNPFVSKVLLATSNVSSIAPKSIIQPEAVARRFDIVVKCVPKRELCIDQAEDVDARRLDTSLPIFQTGEFVEDTHEYHLMKADTRGKFIETGVIMDEAQFIEECVKSYKFKEKRHMMNSAHMEKIMEPQGNMPGSYSNNVRIELPMMDADSSDDEEETCIHCRGTPFHWHCYFEWSRRYQNSVIATSAIKDFNRMLKQTFFVDSLLSDFQKAFLAHKALDPTLRSSFLDYSVDILCGAYLDSMDKTWFIRAQSANTDDLMWNSTFKKFWYKAKMNMFRVINKISSDIGSVASVGASVIGAAKWQLLEAGSTICALYLSYKVLYPYISEFFFSFLDKFFGFKPKWFEKVEEPKVGSNVNHKENVEILESGPLRGRKERAHRIRHERPGIMKPEAPRDLNATDIMHKILEKSMYEFVVVCEDMEQRLGFGVFVRGRVLMIPWHFKEMTRVRVNDENSGVKADSIILLKNRTTDKVYHISVRDILSAEESDEHKSNDVCFVHLPKLHNHPDIINLYMSEKALNTPIDLRVTLFGWQEDRRDCYSQIAQGTLMYEQRVKCYDDELDYVVVRGVRYFSELDRGDCGSPCIISNPSVAPGKVMGFHVAGSSGLGFSNIITKELLQDACVKYHDLDFPPPPEVLMAPQCSKLPFPGSFTPYTKIDKPIQQPVDTIKRKSLLHGLVMPNKVKPARLRQFTRDGVVIDPKAIATAKYGTINNYVVPKPIRRKSVSDFTNHMLKVKSMSSKVKPIVLTFEQACEGIMEMPYINAIPRSTSSGYPYVADPKPGFRGKEWYFGKEEKYDFNRPQCLLLKEEVMNVVNEARKGVRCLHVYVDSLKDECRPEAKVDQGKTRLISCSPLVLAIATRMFYGFWTSFMMTNALDIGVGIGVNPFSDDWDVLARNLMRPSGRGIAGDFSGFDTCHGMADAEDFVQIVNSFYDSEDPTDDLVRKVLAADLTNSIHVSGDVIYQWLGKLPSGSVLTTPFNCVVLHLKMLQCWHLMNTDESQKFYDHVYLSATGDDNVAGISSVALSWFNQNTITQTMSILGYTYTDEQKKATVIADRDIRDLTYLKRGFRYEPYVGRYVAPLDLDSVAEMLNWTSKGPQSQLITATNCVHALEEISLHGSQCFQYWAPRVVGASQEYLDHYIPKENWSQVLSRACKIQDYY